MVKRERYVLAACNREKEKSIMYSTYFTKPGLARGVIHAIEDKEADYISLRIIRPKVKVTGK